MRRRIAALLAGVVAISVIAVVGPALSGASARPATSAPWTPIKGIAVSVSAADKISDAKAASIANSLFSLLASKFHANAVSLNFPFYQSNSRSNNPARAIETASPGRMEELTAIAHKYHLAVEWRPYLYEGNLTSDSRTGIKPSNPALWIQNYWLFLEPYLEAANASGASSFSVALELTSLLPNLSNWEQLIQRSHAIYTGDLLYSQQHDPQVSLPLVDPGYDAYTPIKLASDKLATPANFTKGFEKNLAAVGMEMQSTPADLTVEELSIPAVSKAYNVPNNFHYKAGTKVDRPIQTNWFIGACNAFWALHLKALYYWSIGLDTFTPKENDSKNFYSWYGTASATAIASCFARTK